MGLRSRTQARMDGPEALVGFGAKPQSLLCLRSALELAFAFFVLGEDGGGAFGHDFGGGGATGEGFLVVVVFFDGAEFVAEFEDGDFALAAVAEADGHDGGADACADVDGAGVSAAVFAAAVEAVHVFVAGELSDREFVEAGEGDLAGVGVAGEDEVDVVAPEAVGFFGDVGHCDSGQVAAEAFDGFFAAGVAGVGVVEADDLEHLVAEADDGVAVVEDFDAAAAEGGADFVGAGPIVVVAEDGHHGGVEALYEFFEAIEVALAVADEIAGEQDEIGLFVVRQIDGGELDGPGGDAADVEIGEVCDAQVRELLGVAGGACEAADLDAATGAGDGVGGGAVVVAGQGSSGA